MITSTISRLETKNWRFKSFINLVHFNQIKKLISFLLKARDTDTAWLITYSKAEQFTFTSGIFPFSHISFMSYSCFDGPPLNHWLKFTSNLMINFEPVLVRCQSHYWNNTRRSSSWCTWTITWRKGGVF